MQPFPLLNVFKVFVITCALFRPLGAFGVPQQYERSFRWKLAQFYNLCQVGIFILLSVDRDNRDILMSLFLSVSFV